ncbi:MAG: peroxiredoxin [Steroidobacteraceae bacterium]
MNKTWSGCAAVLLLCCAGAVSAGAPPVGSMAPEFTLPDQHGESISLASKRGSWVVLYFYPKDATPGCTTEACEFRDNIFAFRKAGATVLGISVDDVDSHKSFSTEHSLPFPLLADSAKKVAASYGVLYRALGVMELARRETFIIDPEGRIARHYAKVDPKSHARELLADLAALQKQHQAM